MPETNLDASLAVKPEDRSLSVRGLWEVFLKPTEFFKQLAERPKILVPYILIGIMAAVFFVLTADMIFEMQWQNPQFQERISQSPGMTKEQMRGIVSISTISFGTIAMLIAPLIIAGLAMFWGNFVFAGRSSFRQILSVTLYGEVLYVFGGMILLLPLIFAKGEIGVSFSLAAMVAQLGMEHPLYVALSKLSIFHIWEIVVLGIGFSACLGISTKKGYLTAILSAGLLSAIHVIFAVVQKMMS
jgi:hypothetical protein